MSLFAYKLFVAVAERKNLTKAAGLLNITPSAASHSISSFEKACGFALFSKNRNGAQLTRNGELLLPRIRAILSENERLHEEIAQINGLERGAVHIGVFNSICNNWLPGILHLFHSRHPDINVSIYQEGYQAIENLLLEGVLDIGFVSAPTSEKFSTITLLHDRLLCITPPGYTPENGTYVTAGDLRRQVLFLSQRGYDKTTEEYVRTNNLVLSRNHHITLESSIIALVENGLGCSILPEIMIQSAPGKYNVYPLAENIYRTIALAMLRGRPPSPACLKMIQIIKYIMEKDEDEKDVDPPGAGCNAPA